MSAEPTQKLEACSHCGADATVSVGFAGSAIEPRCDTHDGGFTMRHRRVDLPQAEAVRRAKPGGLLSVVHATARTRSAGRFTDPAAAGAWRELLGAATALAWLAQVELEGTRALPGTLSEAEAATECARLLEGVRVQGTRGHIVISVLELSDAAVRSLGGTVAVRVER